MKYALTLPYTRREQLGALDQEPQEGESRDWTSDQTSSPPTSDWIAEIKDIHVPHLASLVYRAIRWHRHREPKWELSHG